MKCHFIYLFSKKVRRYAGMRKVYSFFLLGSYQHVRFIFIDFSFFPIKCPESIYVLRNGFNFNFNTLYAFENYLNKL